MKFKIFFTRTTGPISTKHGTKHPWAKGIQVYSNERPCPFPREDINVIAKIHRQNFKIFFSRTTEPTSIKHVGWRSLGFFKFFKGPRPFPRGDNSKKFKITSRTIWLISTKLGTKHLWQKETRGFANKDHLFLKKEKISCFTLLIKVMISS